MTPEVIVATEPITSSRTAAETRELLNQVVAAVRQDSQQSTEEFLAETVVPHGGE